MFIELAINSLHQKHKTNMTEYFRQANNND